MVDERLYRRVGSETEGDVWDMDLGSKVGVLNRYQGTILTRSTQEDATFELVWYETPQEALAALVSSDVDTVFMDTLVARATLATLPEAEGLIERQGESEEISYRIAINPDDLELK